VESATGMIKLQFLTTYNPWGTYSQVSGSRHIDTLNHIWRILREVETWFDQLEAQHMWGCAVIIHVDRSQNALKGAIGENLEIGFTKLEKH
jgi:hypothetical protein